MLSDRNLGTLVRQMVQTAVAEATRRHRTPSVLTGTVEDLDSETLDVAYIRMDQEAMGSDPTQSDNWEAPGIVPTIRLGDTYIGEQVRVGFDGAAGASATATSASLQTILPFGTEEGDRIVLDGELGVISVGDDAGAGRRLELDPVGGVRIRSADDVLVGVLDENGYTLRANSTGLVVAELRSGTSGSFRLVDPSGTDDIEMVTASAGTLPNPKFVSGVEANPGTSIVAPSLTPFTSTPADDYELYHAAAFLDGSSQSATWTPPAGTTERLDTISNAGTGTLSVAVADRDPATGAAGTFTSSQSNWTHGLGTHVVIRGGGATSPSYRSLAEQSYALTAATKVTVTAAKPSGVVTGDALVAFVTMANEGGTVPTGWTTPEGWKFLGANFLLQADSILAVGAWVKLATASEPASYDVTISFGAGTKRLHAAIVAIQNPYLVAGGAHIRMSGHPIRRLLAFNEITAASATLCDFQNIPGGYDHLELVFEALSDRSTDALRNIRMRLNADAGLTNYRWQVNWDNAINTSGAGTQDRIIFGRVDGSALNAESGGVIQILGYARPHRRFTIGNDFYITAGGDLVEGTSRSLWLNSTDAVNRVSVSIDTGTTLFNVGSRAYLYGY